MPAIAVMHFFPQAYQLAQETVVALAGSAPFVQAVFGGFA